MLLYRFLQSTSGKKKNRAIYIFETPSSILFFIILTRFYNVHNYYSYQYIKLIVFITIVIVIQLLLKYIFFIYKITTYWQFYTNRIKLYLNKFIFKLCSNPNEFQLVIQWVENTQKRFNQYFVTFFLHRWQLREK